MKYKLLFLSLILMISACTTKTIRIGFDPDVKDYTPIVLDAVADNPDGNFTLLFDDATYPFYPEKALDRYIAVSNNDNGDKKVVFNLEGMKNVTVCGDGTEFLFHGGMVPFYISNSECVTIKGISLDYDYPFTLEGKVVESSDEDKSFVSVIPAEA